MYIVTTVQENHFRITPITQGINHYITQVIEEDHQNKEIHRILHKIIIIDQIVEITIRDQIQMQHNLFLDQIPNQTQEINTIPIINHKTHHITEIETIHIIEIEVIRTIEIRITRTIDQEITHITDQTITDQMTIIKTDHGVIHKIEIQVIIINIEIIPNQHIGIITIIIILTIATEVVHLNIKDILIKYNQIQKQHQTPQVLMTQEITNYNKINCGSSDTESDTENTISVNMITVENDYEPIIYEQPFTLHIYENQLELLHNYYIEPINTTQTAQEINEINTVNKPDENDKTKCLNTNHIYQNIKKEQPREKVWTKPFFLESPRNKEFQPPDLEIDFLIDAGAESKIINIPTWNEIKTLHPKLTPLATSGKLATAQGSTLVNYGKVQIFLLPTRTMEQNKILNKPFKQIFHITDIKHNIIGIPFKSKYIPTINILNSKILIKDKYTKTKNTALTFFQRLNKQPPFFSKFYPIYNQQRKHLKPLSGKIYNFSIKQVHQYDKSQNKQQLFMSDFEFKPIHKFFKITISCIKYLKNTNSDIISLHVYNNTPYQVTLPLGLLGYCKTNATISPVHEKAYRVNNILQLLDICQSTILNEELSINNILSNEKRNTHYFTKTPYFKPTFNITNYTKEQQQFLTMFNFEHSQITQIEFDKLAKQLLKYSTVYATSKFDVGKISSSLHLPLKPDAVFKKQKANKVPIHLHDKVNRLLDILEQYKIISPVNKEEQPKGNTFFNPVIILAKRESLKIVLDARYLNSLIDESKCNWPIEPIQVILTKINGKYFTTADMYSAYNQMPLDEQSRRLTQIVIGNQQYEFNRLFYGISIGPAAFSAFMSKIFRPLILKKNAITYLDDFFMQSQTKEEIFTVLEHYHKILQNENLKAAPDKSHFFLTRVKFLGHNIERNTITPLKSRIDAIQKLQPPTNKKKSKNSLEC